MRLPATLLLALTAVIAITHAQITFVDSETICAIGTTDKALCTYTFEVNTTSWTAAGNGANNQFVCNTASGAVALDNPVASQTFSAGVVSIPVNARCDCVNVTWSINGTDIAVTNDNVDAVLNSCDFCGPATGNTACGTGSEDLCFELGVCTLGECVREEKCPDIPENCQRGVCSLVDGCSYVLDISLDGCVLNNIDGITTTATALTTSSQTSVSLEAPVDVFGVDSDGDPQTISSTDSFTVERNSDGLLELAETPNTSDADFSDGGMRPGMIVMSVLLTIGVSMVAITVLLATSLSSIAPYMK